MIPYLKSKKKCCLIKMRSDDIDHKNNGIGWHIQKEHDEKCSFPKNQLVGANWCGVISNVMLWGLHPDLFKNYRPPRISAHPKGRKS